MPGLTWFIAIDTFDASELLKEFDYLQSNDTDIQTQVTDTFHTMLEQLASDKKVTAVLSMGFFDNNLP